MTRKPTFAEALVPLLGMVLLLGVGYGKYGLPIQFLLIVAAFIAAIIAIALVIVVFIFGRKIWKNVFFAIMRAVHLLIFFYAFRTPRASL